MDDRMSVVRAPIYGAGGTISYTGTAVNSTVPIPRGVTGVWVTCSTDAWAKFTNVVGSTAPAATTADMFCPAGVTVFLPNVSNTGEPMQLSVIRDATSGSARYTPAM